MNISVRGVDGRSFRELKAESARRGVPLGQTLTSAIRLWLRSQGRARQEKRSLLEFQPVDLGDTRLSEEVDRALYAEK